MKRTIFSCSCCLLLVGGVVIATRAQDRAAERSATNVAENQSESRENGAASGDDESSGAETRLRYDDEENRLEIDVDEEIRFREERSQDGDWTENGEFDLRYDSDRNTLAGQGEGTLQLDEVGSDMARWWQSWWEEERRGRRSRQLGAESGANAFIRRHDDNQDGYLSHQELPNSERSEFSRIDSNDDGYLSRAEVQRFGDSLYGQRTRANQTTRAADQGNETWSQWWASWWSDDEHTRDRDAGSESGARQFIRLHDDNNDGYVSLREIPPRMRSDFAEVDRNNDNYLSLGELRQAGVMTFGRRAAGDRAHSESRATANRSRNPNQEDQSWSQWWESWWSDNEEGTVAEISDRGSREFIRRHDRNNDGFLVRSEMPDRMYDEFARIDRNDDRRLTSAEIRRYAEESRANRRHDDRPAYAGRSQDRSPATTARSGHSPSQAAYIWIVDKNLSPTNQRDLQQAYTLLLRLDENRDGRISQDELSEQGEETVMQWCRDRFEALDRNSDNSLSRDEALASIFGLQFDQFDQNNDGSLTLSEIRQRTEKRFASQTTSSREETIDRRR